MHSPPPHPPHFRPQAVFHNSALQIPSFSYIVQEYHLHPQPPHPPQPRCSALTSPPEEKKKKICSPTQQLHVSREREEDKQTDSWRKKQQGGTVGGAPYMASVCTHVCFPCVIFILQLQVNPPTLPLPTFQLVPAFDSRPISSSLPIRSVYFVIFFLVLVT